MPNDVFISYRRKDIEFVTQLHQELTNRGISAWFDKESIEVADHWRTSIRDGIRDCKVFILILSPDSVESVNIRKEVDLAERHGKKIIPLMWRKTDIPVAFEYALAGIQWIDFNETASQENFDELADVVKRLIGGSSMDEATSGKQMAKESTIPVIKKEATPAANAGGRKLDGRRKLGGLKKKQTVSSVVIGYQVISIVITTLGLDIEDQDFVNSELRWLFSAADNFMKFRLGEIDLSQPIAVPIPEDAERSPLANNTIIPTNMDEDLLVTVEFEIERILKRIRTRLNNLNYYWDREASLGEARYSDAALQNSIKAQKYAIIQEIRKLGVVIDQIYGILVTSPDQLIELLG